MSYLLDSDVFIQAKNLHYGLDFCPAFWEWLIAANAAGLVLSTEKVGDEIEAGGDELSEWAAGRGTGFFVKPDAAIFAGAGHGERMGDGAELRTGCGKYVSASSGLLFGSSRARP